MEAEFCVDCLEDALGTHGRPEVCNSDQGSQFTSDAFTNVLKREDVTISIDGRGLFFNAERPHQLLAYQTPDQVYRTGIGGGAMILDKFSTEHDEEKAKPGQRRATAVAEEITA